MKSHLEVIGSRKAAFGIAIALCAAGCGLEQHEEALVQSDLDAAAQVVRPSAVRVVKTTSFAAAQAGAASRGECGELGRAICAARGAQTCTEVERQFAELRLEPAECAFGISRAQFLAQLLPPAVKPPFDPCASIPAFWCSRYGEDAPACEDSLQVVLMEAAPLASHCQQVFWDFAGPLRATAPADLPAALRQALHDANAHSS